MADRSGRSSTSPPVRRIVSLSPAATQLLTHLGAGDRLVACSHLCDAPPGVVVVTGPDRSVQPQRIGQLEPDLVIADSRTGPGDAGGSGWASLTLGARSLDGILDELLRIGRAAGLEAGADAAVVGWRTRFTRAAEHVNAYTDGPRVSVVIGIDPLRVAGGWIAEMVERAGASHPLGSSVSGETATFSDDRLAASCPDVLIVCPEKGGVAEAGRIAEVLGGRSWFADLPCSRGGRVALVDGRPFHVPGPGLIAAFEWLVGYLNDVPTLMPPGFPWKPWTAPGSLASVQV